VDSKKRKHLGKILTSAYSDKWMLTDQSVEKDCFEREKLMKKEGVEPK